MTTVIQNIAAWCGAQTDFSAAAKRLAAEAITDTLACIVAGRADSATLAVRRAMESQIGASGARIVGGGRAAPAVAALINGTAAHALDFDDNFRPGMSHASAVIVPALLAIADLVDASGEDFVKAYLIALQAQAYVGWGVGYNHYVAGWHGTSTIGSVGTAAGTAWLLGLDTDGIARALTLGVSMASGVKGQFGTSAKPFHAGMAARNAVEAALLAQAGLSGKMDILEGEQGLRELYSGGIITDFWDKTPIDGPHVIETTGVVPKRHPCCGSTHMVIDAILDLQAKHGFTADDIARVDTLVGVANWRNLAYPAPVDEMQARFSMQYCVARALRKGVLSLSDFTQSAVDQYAQDPLMAVITMEHYGEENSKKALHPHKVTLWLKNGGQLEGARSVAKGNLGDAFNDADRMEKFVDCCTGLTNASVDGLFVTCETIALQRDLKAIDPLFNA
ncbi:MmgE/PrpD family protein [Ketogulonicigenium vulgare]|uniref:MmgE/PrpD family protein n=1 Tax=Ketogulonicigenium vulgare (strain WSH-001) TaxID=759362 RepID=F9YBQ4_KETVW|nr:MmgE/PrpD family protein [Ketogulonicigenium vulgare]AEM42806.1 MmgE/PrpD family protein [Ketogulonicigenium vulgare WSH-001]ALJ82763.1 2-methylcitrate dehydratase [Ketogulonicigenium vulgare]